MKSENARLLIEFPNEADECVESDSSLKCGWTTFPGEKSGYLS